MNPDCIIISPGPASPDDLRILACVVMSLLSLANHAAARRVLACKALHFLVVMVRANVPMHGKTSPIRHDGQGVYQGLPQQLDIMRYHSLMVDAASPRVFGGDQRSI